MRRWDERGGWRGRFAAIGAIALLHVALLALLLNTSRDSPPDARERDLQLVEFPPPRPPVLPSPKPQSRPHPKAAAPTAKPALAPSPTPPEPSVVAAPQPSVAGAAQGGGDSGAGAGQGSGTANGAGAGSLARHAQWIGDELNDSDYPEAAKRARIQGIVEVRYTVGVDGWIRDCRVDRFEGSSELGTMTCALVEQRRLYDPARNALGRPVEELAGRRFRFTLRPHRR